MHISTPSAYGTGIPIAMGTYVLTFGAETTRAAWQHAPAPKVTQRVAEAGRDYPVEFVDQDGESVPVGTAQATPDAAEVITDNRLLIDIPEGTLIYGDFEVRPDGVAELQRLVIKGEAGR